MKKSKLVVAVLSLIMMLAVLTVPAYASTVKTNVKAAETTETTETSEDEEEAEATDADATKGKAIASGIAIGLAAFAGALGMAYAVGKSNEAISRQPEATGSIRTSLMLGLVFIETVVIYALIVTILIIFVM